MTKLAVIYYSSTGTVKKMAERVAQAGLNAGAEVRLRSVPELAPLDRIETNPRWLETYNDAKEEGYATNDDILWADAVLFGSPTRYGNVASALKNYIDGLGAEWAQGLLSDKVYAGFTASQTDHGGQESTLLALYNTFYHFGGIIVPPGYTDPLKFVDGNPYGVSHVSGLQNNNPLRDAELYALDHLAQRVVKISTLLTDHLE